jgi:hypothetical protein
MKRFLLVVLVCCACADPEESSQDAAVSADAGRADSGLPDSGAFDAGRTDSGAADAAFDAGAVDPDAAPADAAEPDASTGGDVGPTDALPNDAATVGGALHFDGVDDQLLIPAAAGGFNELAFSEEAWFRTTTSSVALLEVYSTAQLGADRALFLRSGVLCFYVFSPTRTERCSTARYDDGAWHHAAGTLGPGGMTLYVDGMLEIHDPNTTQSAFNWDTSLRAGYGRIGADTEFRYLAGDLDEIRVWSVERTEAEIRDHHLQTIDPATAGLVGYWQLNETGTAAVARDATAAHNDAILSGFTNPPSPWITDGAH